MKVGDRIISSRYGVYSLHTIVRETPTQWVLNDDTRLKKGNIINAIGAGTYDPTGYHEVTEELKEAYMCQRTQREFVKHLDEMRKCTDHEFMKEILCIELPKE